MFVYCCFFFRIESNSSRNTNHSNFFFQNQHRDTTVIDTKKCERDNFYSKLNALSKNGILFHFLQCRSAPFLAKSLICQFIRNLDLKSKNIFLRLVFDNHFPSKFEVRITEKIFPIHETSNHVKIMYPPNELSFIKDNNKRLMFSEAKSSYHELEGNQNWKTLNNKFGVKMQKIINSGDTFKPKKFITIDNRILSELFRELATVTNEKKSLELENKNLQVKITQLVQQNRELQEKEHAQQAKLDQYIEIFKKELAENESHLAEINKNLVETQKNHMEEIEKLRAENKQLKESVSKANLEEQLQNMHGKLEEYKNKYTAAKTEAEDYLQRSKKYKTKLKQAVNIINDLNNMISEYTFHSETKCISCQTGDMEEEKIESEISEPKNYHHTGNTSEDILLSEIFFKTKVDCDNELFILNEANGNNPI